MKNSTKAFIFSAVNAICLGILSKIGSNPGILAPNAVLCVVSGIAGILLLLFGEN